jgi:hypothetical protein
MDHLKFNRDQKNLNENFESGRTNETAEKILDNYQKNKNFTSFKKLATLDQVSKKKSKTREILENNEKKFDSPNSNLDIPIRNNNDSLIVPKNLNLTDNNINERKNSNCRLPINPRSERSKFMKIANDYEKINDSVGPLNENRKLSMENNNSIFGENINSANEVKDQEERLQDSTFDKNKKPEKTESLFVHINKENDSPQVKKENSNLEIKHDQKRPSIQLVLKENNNSNNNLYHKEISGDPSVVVCRICYDEENDEKGGLIWPCTCTGTCKYIHESCLKTWIENNFQMNKIKAECEICKHPYSMKFCMKHKFSKNKLFNCLKSLVSVTIVTSIVLTLVFTVIYVVVTALASMSDQEKKNFIIIIMGIALGLLVIIVIISFKNCRKNFYEPYMNDWKVHNLDGCIININ